MLDPLTSLQNAIAMASNPDEKEVLEDARERIEEIRAGRESST